MNIITNPKEMNHFLSMIRSVVNPRSSTNNGIQITAKDGAVSILGTDGNCSMTGKFNATVLEEGSAFVPVMFADIMAKQPGDEVTITSEGKSVVVTGSTSNGNSKKKTRSSISVIDGKLTVPDTKPVTVYSMDAAAFCSVLESVRYAIATDENRMVLTGLYLEVYPDKAMFTSLDGFRMSHCELNGKISLPEGSEGVKGIIPGRTISLLSKVARSGESGEEIQIALANGQFAAECGGFTLTSSLVAGEYIDYNRILPSESKIQAKVVKEELKGALDRASVYTADDKNSAVKLTFKSEGFLKITAKSRFGNTEEEICAASNGFDGEFVINFNANYLKDTIKAVVGEDVVFGFTTASTAATARDGKCNKIELILPVRVFEQETSAA